MSTNPYETKVEAHLISGTAGTGKTQALIDAALELMAGGESPEDIVLLAVSRPAVDELRARMEKALGRENDLPTISTMRDLQLRLIRDPKVVGTSGRKPRLPLRFEENFLMEDMKTGGVHPHRLAEMLKFFYKSAVELEPMDSQWFYSDEEENTFKLLTGYLDYYRMYLSPLLPAACYKLVAEGNVPDRARIIPFLLVDDYQCLSKASQCLAGLLAGKQLWIAGDELAGVVEQEEFPHPDGLQEFAQANPTCTMVNLSECRKSQAVTDALNTLITDEALGADAAKGAASDQGEFKLMAYERPRKEFQGVATMVCDYLQAGIDAQDIAIAVPHRTWVRNMEKALRDQGVPVARMSQASIAGDFREAELCHEARIISLLRLMNDPDDELALRCWCGFNDYLGNSEVFSVLRKSNQHLSLRVTGFNKGQSENALFDQQGEHVMQAIDEACEILSSVRSLKGMTLLRALAKAVGSEDVPKGILSAIGTVDPTMTADQMCAAIDDHSLFPRLRGEGVQVGLTDEFMGQNKKVMILSGFVGGLIPSRSWYDPTMVERDKRPALIEKDMRRTYACAGKAADKLIITYFTGANLVESEQLKLKVFRVRLLNGERVCEVHASETLRAYTGEAFNDL